MSDTGKTLLVWLLVLIAFNVSLAPFVWYGDRHRWSIKQYRWVGFWAILFWTIVVGVWVFHIPIGLMITVDAGVLVPAAILILILNRAETKRA